MKFLSICFCLFSFLHSAEYKFTPLTTENTEGFSWFICGITEKGQVYGTCGKEDNDLLFVADKNEIRLINHEEFSSKGGCVANDVGQMIANGGPTGIFIWSASTEFCSLNIRGAKKISLNDKGQLIGSYLPEGAENTRAFFYENNILTDMGPGSEFSKHFENLGFQPLDIWLTSINNNSEIAGLFSHQDKDHKSYNAFFWDGQMHLVSLDKKPDEHFPNCWPKVNNYGIILLSYFSGDHTCLWNVNDGTFQNIPHFSGMAINDHSVVFGFTGKKTSSALWEKGKITKLKNLLDKSTNKFTPQLEACSHVTGSNNKNQISGICHNIKDRQIFPCIFEPKTN